DNTWATDAAGTGAGKFDLTQKGTLYPICGATWLLVYTGLNNGAVANANSRLNADQRRNLFSYVLYILSSPGQKVVASNFYAPLTNGLRDQERTGFIAGF